jgi:hypothetical protein
MKTNSFNRQIRQFRNLANRVNQLLATGEWATLPALARNRIISKLNALYRQVRFYLQRKELKKILAAAAIFIGFPLISQAQSFAPPLLNPFGLEPDSVYITAPAFADIDNDGDFDLFAGSYGDSYYGSVFNFYENTGTPDSPSFAPPQSNPFGLDSLESPFIFPAFADIDNDGDLDLLVGTNANTYYGEGMFFYFENTGSVTSPSFAEPQSNPFGMVPPFGFAVPVFADLDHDGDFDLMCGDGNGHLMYYQNTGSVTQPAFEEPVQDPFGLTPAYYIGAPAFSDIDHDGDLDLFVGEYYGNFQYYQNTGTDKMPEFADAVTNPFGLAATYYWNFPTIADLDDDSDDDILVGEYYGMFQYFKNTEYNIGIAENQGEGFFSLFPNPATESVYIVLKDESPAYMLEVSIIDLNGRGINSGKRNTEDLLLRTEDLSPGVYIVKIVQGERVYSEKLIIR